MSVPASPLPGLVSLQRRDLLAALLLAGVLLIGAAFRVHPDVCGQCHDDAIYVVTAKSLAEGDGYRLMNLPGEPPQTKYPPLYAACLALLWKLWPDFPANLLLLQSFSMLCAAGFLASTYLYLVRFNHLGRGLAFTACLACAVNHSFLMFAVVTMSEMLFGVLVVGMLWWLELALRSPEARPAIDCLGGILLALPFLCRSVGLLFIPLGLMLLWHYGKRWRGAIVGASIATIPWLLWSLAAANQCKADPVQGYYTDYVGWWTKSGLPALPEVVNRNLIWIVTTISNALLGGLTQRLPDSLWLLLLAPPGFAALGVLLYDIRRGQPLATILAAYLVLVSVWPWLPHRFVAPMLPFLMVYLLRAVLLRPSLALPARILIGVAIAASALETIRQIHDRHVHDSPMPEQGEVRHSWRPTRRLLDWLTIHSDRRDVIAAGVDPLVYLYTGRQAYYPITCPPLPLFYGHDYPHEEMVTLMLRGMAHYRPRYLVLTANFHGEDEFRAVVKQLDEKHPGLLVQVYQDDDDKRFAVYEIRYPSSFPIEP
jgi:hypothetical protein